MNNEPAFLQEGFASILLGNVLIGIVPILVLVVFFVIVVRLANRRKKGDVRQKTEDMLNKDNAANLTRNKEIGEELFYTPDEAKLPLREYTEAEMRQPVAAYMWQKKVVDISAKKMLRFDRAYSNVELKQMFGPSNLEYVARYEENFNNFIHSMRHWAEALLAAGQTEDARRILEESVAAGSELSQSYTKLADIYAEAGDAESLARLKSTVEKSPMPGKNIAAKHIENKLAEARKQ